MKYKTPKVIRDKKAKKQALVNFLKTFLFKGGMFFLTSLLAVVCAFRLSVSEKTYLPQNLLQGILVCLFIFAIFIIIFLSYKRFKKYRELIYKGLFLIVAFWGGMTALSVFIPVFGAILVMGVLIALWLNSSTVLAHNILVVLGLSGAASFLGLGVSPSAVVIILLVISMYDFIAVYKTKYTASLLQEMIKNKVIFGLIIPKEAKHFKCKIKEVKVGEKFLILGAGNVFFPALFASSLVFTGLNSALIISVFSLLGLLFSYWLFASQKGAKKNPEPMSVFPPVALFAIIGYLLTLLI